MIMVVDPYSQPCLVVKLSVPKSPRWQLVAVLIIIIISNIPQDEVQLSSPVHSSQ